MGLGLTVKPFYVYVLISKMNQSGKIKPNHLLEVVLFSHVVVYCLLILLLGVVNIFLYHRVALGWPKIGK